MINYFFVLIIILTMIMLYLRYVEINTKTLNEEASQKKINEFLLNIDKDKKKTIIWIHIPYRYNARNWSSFYSRSSTNLNQPYQHLTIESIIKHNTNYHICLIDDYSFKKLLPEWNINIHDIAEPTKNKVRLLGLLKILYQYGGMVVPSSFVCFKPLCPLYDKCIRTNKAFIVENNNNIINKHRDFIPDASFIGASKENPAIYNLINNLKLFISEDFTDEMTITGKVNRYCRELINKNMMTLINANIIGVADKDYNPIIIDDLFQDTCIELNSNCLGVYIPQEELLRRNNYNWFCKLEPDDIYKSTFALAQFFNIAQS